MSAQESTLNRHDETLNIVGAALILAMYFWNTFWPTTESELLQRFLYQLGNLVGASLLAFGLRRRSTAACLLNLAWSLIALQSLGRLFL